MLAKGERERNRVLTDAEWQQYINTSASVLSRGVTLQSSFAAQKCVLASFFRFDGKIIYLNGWGGLIQVTEGKTKAARRMLPMLPVVYSVVKERHEQSGKPESGWIFPSTSREGHLNRDTAKDQHAKAIERANEKARKENAKELRSSSPISSGTLR